MKHSRSIKYNKAFRRIQKQRFRFKLALGYVGFLVFIALFAPLLANEKPLLQKTDKGISSPIVSSFLPKKNTLSTDDANNIDWKVHTLVAFSPSTKDFDAINLPPLSKGHLLGTDRHGKDIFAILIYGTRTALGIGIAVVTVALLLGVTLGVIGGYFGNHLYSLQRGVVTSLLLGFALAIFYGFIFRKYILINALERGTDAYLLEVFISIMIMLVILGFSYLVGRLLGFFSFFNTKIKLPLDSFIKKGIEIINATPVLLLIFFIIAVLPPDSLLLIMLFLGVVSWTNIARLVRAETFKIRGASFVESAKALGQSDARIIWKHILPNVLSPIFVAVAFGISNTVLLEAVLSFLEVGIPREVVSWGKLLNTAKDNPSAWWLTLSPGVAIFFCVLAFNTLGEGIQVLLDPKSV